MITFGHPQYHSTPRSSYTPLPVSIQKLEVMKGNGAIVSVSEGTILLTFNSSHSTAVGKKCGNLPLEKEVGTTSLSDVPGRDDVSVLST